MLYEVITIHRADFAGGLDAELLVVQVGREIVLRERLTLFARLDQRHHELQMQPLSYNFV